MVITNSICILLKIRWVRFAEQFVKTGNRNVSELKIISFEGNLATANTREDWKTGSEHDQ